MNISQIDKMRKLQDRLINRSCTEDNLKTSLLLMEAAEAIGNLLASRHEWISVEDRLPTYKDGKVLIYTAYGISIGEKTVSNRWRGDNAIPKQITHWMPLPPPPTEKEN